MSDFKNEFEKTLSEELQIYAAKQYESQLCSIMLSSNKSSYTSITVDSMNLFPSNIGFAHYIFQNPRNALKLLDGAFQIAALKISRTHTLKSDMVYKEKLRVRLIALPDIPEVYRSNLPTCSDVGQFLCISGTIIRASTAKMIHYKKLWRCTKCKYQFIVEADVEQDYICGKPIACLNPEWCSGKSFTLMSTDVNSEWCKDYQEITLQEQVYNLDVGTVARTMVVILEDELVESCHPGNNVIVSGVLIQQWKPLIKNQLIDINLVFLAHNIEVQNTMSSGIVSKDMVQEFVQFWLDHRLNPLMGRNFILSSICPQVFGLYIVKLAVALILAGGVRKKEGNSRIRGDSHLLLIGDPGTAKSQFLKYAFKVSSRSVITSGIGISNAGLTVSAVKESDRWQLEAGALVLADGGICCIDEFSCIKEQDKTCIHEAMEQQTISVAKAGLVCSLNTGCSVLAATNPKGKYDKTMSMSVNTALGTPLLSRFDIILVLLDTYDESWDEMVASYMLEGRNFANQNNNKLWSVSKMRSYFSLVRHINPKVMPEAERIMQTYYKKQRSLQPCSASRTTPRLLQSLVRLAEGHARLMFRSEVLVCDAVIAILLMESSMIQNSILEDLNPLHTIFPDNPNDEYEQNAKVVLRNLSLEFPIKENYEKFYTESSIKDLLKGKPFMCHFKNYPYIFGSTQCSNSSNHSIFEKSFNNDSISSDSKTVVEKHGTISIELHDNDMIVESTSIASGQALDLMDVDVDNGNSFHRDLETVSNKRYCKEYSFTNGNIKDNSFAQNVFVSNFNKENISVLNQVLNEPDDHASEFKEQCTNISEIKSIFCENTSITSTSCHERNSVKDPFTHNFSQSQRNISILEELVLSPENETAKQHEPTDKNSNEKNKIISSSFQNVASTSAFFPAKRSLADQLKKFAFSKSKMNSQKTFEMGFTSNIHKEKNSNLVQSDIRYNKNLPNKSKDPCIAYDTDKIDTDDIYNKIVNNSTDNCLDKSENVVQTNKGLSSSSESRNNNFEIIIHNSEQMPVNEPLQNILPLKKELPDALKKFMFSKKTSKYNKRNNTADT